MAWDDIDRSLIVPGLNTRGSDEVSFGFYLDEFSRALDERRNMIERGGAPSLGLEFGKGMIFNQGFSGRFRILVSGYKSLWDDNNFYSSSVLNDPVNASSLVITDNDIIALITQEVWDIFSDPNSFSIEDLYTAAVINAMYTFYENTNVIARGSSVGDTSTQNVPTFAATGSSYNYNMPANIGDPNESYGAVLGGTSFSFTDSDQTGAIVEIGYSARRDIFGPTFRWIAAADGNGISNDGSECFLLSKDLNDNILSMNYTPLFTVTRNIVIGTGFERSVYSTEFPLVGGASFPQVDIKWNAKSSSQTPKGTKKAFHYRGSGPTGPKGLKDESDDLEFYGELQQLGVSLPSIIFVDINNSGLEFFIG